MTRGMKKKKIFNKEGKIKPIVLTHPHFLATGNGATVG
jgi:hypothetical protein